MTQTNTAEKASTKTFTIMLFLAGIIGFVASGILILERIALYIDPGHKTSCDMSPFVSCGSVMASWQAALLGFPNPFIGIIAFTVILLTASLVASKVVLPRWYWISLYVGTTIGFTFIVWLWSQSLYSIGALCLYCIAVWCVMIPLWVLMTRHVARLGYLGSTAKNRIAGFLDEWWWVIVVLFYIGILATIFFRFSFYWLSFI